MSPNKRVLFTLGAKMKNILSSACVILVLFVASCAPIKRVSGYAPLENELAQLKIGSFTKDEVIKKLGEPLNPNYKQINSWIYIQQELETNGFLAPKIDKRVVVNLVFDENAQLSKIKYYDLTDGAEVDFDSNIVLSDGRKLTFWQQMFGNIGNFSSEQFLN